MNNSFISERREIIEAKLYVNSHLMIPSKIYNYLMNIPTIS
jgi:hypothetical protein